MKIKPNIYQKIVVILMSFLYFGVANKCLEGILWGITDSFAFWVIICCGYCTLTIYFIFNVFVVGRTYRYSQEGCTISFLSYRKSYVWEELQIKKYEKDFIFPVGTGMGASYGGADGVFFSVKPYKYKKSGSPITSSEIFQPSKFYVLFPHEMKKHSIIPYPVADRDKFLGLLKEWGGEIEGLENENT